MKKLWKGIKILILWTSVFSLISILFSSTINPNICGGILFVSFIHILITILIDGLINNKEVN